MTMWFDDDPPQLVENNGHDYAEIDDSGELRFDLSERRKAEELRRVAEKAVEAHDDGGGGDGG